MRFLALTLAVIFFVVAVLYWTGSLQAGTSHPGPHHLHATLFFVLALLALAWMRFADGSRALPRR